MGKNLTKYSTLRLILGDQLNIKHSWFKETKHSTLYVLMEIRSETDYVTHHIQKVIGFFAAMREFGRQLRLAGHNVEYFQITDDFNKQSFEENLSNLISDHKIERFEYLEPDEYRLDVILKTFVRKLNIASEIYSTEHFYTNRNELGNFFKDKKESVMETFYRDMRKRHDILMISGKPEGGKWNFDHSNRKPYKGEPPIPSFKYFLNQVEDIVADIKNSEIKTIGNFETKTFNYPINRSQALEQLKFFCSELLQYFGDYQDAMVTGEPYLFHSRLSFALNLKLIGPKDIVQTVLNYYRKNKTTIDISQVEGFIRQIVGWREFMRGMYWWQMPDLKNSNFLKNHNNLPSFYWGAKTEMNCLKHTIKDSLDNGYAHHIQRLMITGNYALLNETNPDEVDNWYLGIYVDAVEWVQLPNTRGMSQFADGGKMATKPYVSSANYINKMSDYCPKCTYNHKEKYTDNACPFNSLYWNFLDSKKSFLKDNPRMGMMYSLLDKMEPDEKEKIIERASSFLK
ncbi:cryptochrome/photolyase family protein [Aegicerativicinus sediminis]|uniref:cryptochrome/photolyase family protein n=1 Tax=Aegicerativicinus sediminis TaxID=2893202 RepID=UPI001E565855|nr:cryptochrome/photolyase family protein [Aegicerativicinus sediminis]